MLKPKKEVYLIGNSVFKTNHKIIFFINMTLIRVEFLKINIGFGINKLKIKSKEKSSISRLFARKFAILFSKIYYLG